MRKAFAEMLGTFTLVFAGTGAIVVNDVTGGQVTHIGVSLAFGLVVMAMVFSLGEISGAHLNPAVTLGLAAAGRMNWRSAPGYVSAQAAGAILASVALKAVFPSHANLGATVPIGSAAQSFAIELLLTFFLMIVVLSVSSASMPKGVAAPFAIGGVIALDALVGGPVSGASMNPARSLGPALVSGQWGHFWLYVAAPAAGSLLAVAIWGSVLNRPAADRLEQSY